MMSKLIMACAVVLMAAAALQAQRGAPATAGPLMTIDTVKGTIAIRLFQAEAPKSVAQILGLVQRNFYRGQRIHRVERTLVQFGDPQSRDVSRRDWWGRSGSGNPIGVAEFSKRTHQRGSVGMAHGGNARNADSQIYILKAGLSSLNGKHVIIGQVTSGMEVVDTLQVTDVLRNVSLTGVDPK